MQAHSEGLEGCGRGKFWMLGSSAAGDTLMKKNLRTICWRRINRMSYVEAESACDMFIKISRRYVHKESACDICITNQQAVFWWRISCLRCLENHARTSLQLFLDPVVDLFTWFAKSCQDSYCDHDCESLNFLTFPQCWKNIAFPGFFWVFHLNLGKLLTKLYPVVHGGWQILWPGRTK